MEFLKFSTHSVDFFLSDECFENKKSSTKWEHDGISHLFVINELSQLNKSYEKVGLNISPQIVNRLENRTKNQKEF